MLLSRRASRAFPARDRGSWGAPTEVPSPGDLRLARLIAAPFIPSQETSQSPTSTATPRWRTMSASNGGCRGQPCSSSGSSPSVRRHSRGARALGRCRTSLRAGAQARRVAGAEPAHSRIGGLHGGPARALHPSGQRPRARHLLHVASQHLVHLEPLLVGAREPLRGEALRLASRFAEFAGWLAQHAGDLAGAQHWTDRALYFVEESADPAGRAYVLMRKSAIAADRLEHGRAVSLAVAARRDAPRLPPRARALALRQRAISQVQVREGGIATGLPTRRSKRSQEPASRASSPTANPPS